MDFILKFAVTFRRYEDKKDAWRSPKGNCFFSPKKDLGLKFKRGNRSHWTCPQPFGPSELQAHNRPGVHWQSNAEPFFYKRQKFRNFKMASLQLSIKTILNEVFTIIVTLKSQDKYICIISKNYFIWKLPNSKSENPDFNKSLPEQIVYAGKRTFPKCVILYSSRNLATINMTHRNCSRALQVSVLRNLGL